jgi:hypothetical protein
MQSIFTSIAKLLGRKSITNDEILEVLRNHEKRILELEGEVGVQKTEVAGLKKGFEEQKQTFDERLKELAKKGQATKLRTTADLKRLEKDLKALVDALDLVVAGEFAPERRKEINTLIKIAKGHRTRVNKVLETRLH